MPDFLRQESELRNLFMIAGVLMQSGRFAAEARLDAHQVIPKKSRPSESCSVLTDQPVQKGDETAG